MTKHMQTNENTWEIGGKRLTSRLLIGSALYPSPANMSDAIKTSGAQIVTVALRRQSAGAKSGGDFWNIIKSSYFLSFIYWNVVFGIQIWKRFT